MPTPQSPQPMIRHGASGSWDEEPQPQPGFFTRLSQSMGLPSTDAELYANLHNLIHPAPDPQFSTRNEMINSVVGPLLAPLTIAQGLYHTGKTVVGDARNKNYGGALGGAIGLLGQVANPEDDPEIAGLKEAEEGRPLIRVPENVDEVDPDKWYTPPEGANVSKGVSHAQLPRSPSGAAPNKLGPMIRQNADNSPAYRDKFSVFHNPAEKRIANMTPEERMAAMDNERQLFIQHKAPINNNINSNALEMNDADTGNLELMPHPMQDMQHAIPVERQPFNPVLNADPFATTEADEAEEEAQPIIRTRKRR